MMSSLFVRELLSLPVFKPAKLYQKLLALLFWGIGAAAIIAIECFIYNKVYDTFSTYKDVNRSLTVIVLGVFALGAVIVLLPRIWALCRSITRPPIRRRCCCFISKRSFFT